MDYFEKNLYTYSSKGSHFYDIFNIWTENEKDLIKFLNELNKKYKFIQFEYQL